MHLITILVLCFLGLLHCAKPQGYGGAGGAHEVTMTPFTLSKVLESKLQCGHLFRALPSYDTSGVDEAVDPDLISRNSAYSLINAFRKAHGAAPLKHSDDLAQEVKNYNDMIYHKNMTEDDQFLNRFGGMPKITFDSTAESTEDIAANYEKGIRGAYRRLIEIYNYNDAAYDDKKLRLARQGIWLLWKSATNIACGHALTESGAFELTCAIRDAPARKTLIDEQPDLSKNVLKAQTSTGFVDPSTFAANTPATTSNNQQQQQPQTTTLLPTTTMPTTTTAVLTTTMNPDLTWRNAMYAEINRYRAKHGSPPLKHNDTLTALAQKYEDVAINRNITDKDAYKIPNAWPRFMYGSGQWNNGKVIMDSVEASAKSLYAGLSTYYDFKNPGFNVGRNRYAVNTFWFLWKSTTDIGCTHGYTSTKTYFQLLCLMSPGKIYAEFQKQSSDASAKDFKENILEAQ